MPSFLSVRYAPVWVLFGLVLGTATSIPLWGTWHGLDLFLPGVMQGGIAMALAVVSPARASLWSFGAIFGVPALMIAKSVSDTQSHNLIGIEVAFSAGANMPMLLAGLAVGSGVHRLVARDRKG